MASLWQATAFSLEVAAGSTAVVAAVGTPLALWMARRRFFGKSLVEALIVLPLVLPPTVVGFGLIVLMGRHGWVGGLLGRLAGGYSIMFRPEGAMLAGAVVGLPLYYLPARAAFAGIDQSLIETARLMGAGPAGTFWHIMIPLARRGLISGLLLAASRILGEFGATVMVFGDLPRQTTLPIAVYDAWLSGDNHAAGMAAAVLAGISLVMTLAFNRSPLLRPD